MLKWLSNLFSYGGCVHTWSAWEKEEQRFTRPVNPRDGNLYTSGVATVSFTEVYQERHCTKCGRIQQEKLEY